MKRALHLAGRTFVCLMHAWVAFSVIVCGLTIISLGHHLATKPNKGKHEQACVRHSDYEPKRTMETR